MTIRFHITVDANTTSGGKVISATSNRSINGAKVAYAGNQVSCPKCNSTGVIQPDGPRNSDVLNGRQIALSDDLCLCKCNPPPRLVASQTFSKQIINAEWQAAKADDVAETAAKLNTSASSATAESDDFPLVLLDDKTEEPYRNRTYKLELKDKVIEGMTDQNGATRPLTASERAAVVKWHIVGETAFA
jgi:uncharacterized Zn-binding protein involved in type VI secretion